MSKVHDLTGQRFGNLIVVERYFKEPKPGKRKRTYWLCQCECGNKTIVDSSHLRSGHTKSCGCMSNAPRTMINGISTITHKERGCSHTSPLYNTYRAMLQRCENPNAKGYKIYGGRGISVCEEWENFKNFETWAYNNGWKQGLTLDRIDVNGNYCPENCRWATAKEQANNTRYNRVYELNGVSMTMQQWAEFIGISYFTLRNRLDSGWDIERAVKEPIHVKNRKRA